MGPFSCNSRRHQCNALVLLCGLTPTAVRSTRTIETNTGRQSKHILDALLNTRLTAQ